MKTKFFLAFTILISSVMFSCSKSNDAVSIPGNYTVSYIQSGATMINLPANGVSAIVVVTQPNSTSITAKMIINNNGQTQEQDLGIIPTKTETDGSLGLYAGATKAGFIKVGNFEVDGTDNTGTRVVIRAKK
jgi:hypothetical protein